VKRDDGIAAAKPLPGPAAMRLGISCAWRLPADGAVVCFAVPGPIVIPGLHPRPRSG
jgi:hypothetical protein